MSWFEDLTGVEEHTPDQVREQLAVDGHSLRSLANGKSWIYGDLEVPTLDQLRKRATSVLDESCSLSVHEVVADVQELHRDETKAGAMFQVASQFNLLEMVSPGVTPEQGVGIYENDRTQGPACAIAAGAGTIYRNYFVQVNGRHGQTADNQIDCLADVGSLLGNAEEQLWQMRNGYALASSGGLAQITQQLIDCSEAQKDRLRQALRIGVQHQTMVTLGDASHCVTQAYCSALPVAYSPHDASKWEAFARLVLEAAYEATLCAAIENFANTGNNRLFLTLLGGGAFGNRGEWITDAIRRAINLYAHAPLEVAIVSYGASSPVVQQLTREFNA